MKPFGWLFLGLTYLQASIEAAPEHVVIVGAGPSGIAAARRLLEKGVSNVEIVEARDRLGGRVYTDFKTFDGVPADLGASWIHGIKENILTQWSDEFDLKRVTTAEENGVKFYSDGKKYTSKEFDESVKKWEDWLEDAEKARDKLDENKDEAFAETLKRTEPEDGDYNDEETNLFLSYWLEFDYGFPETMSTQYWDTDEAPDGDDQLFPGGYAELFSKVVDKYKISIQYNKTVRSIDSSKGNKNPIKLSFDDGTTMESDALIVTVPLGVLQSDLIEFKPPLPTKMTDAMGRLKMGAVTKVFVQFEEDFWTEKVDDAQYIFMNPSKEDSNDKTRGKWTGCLNGNVLFPDAKDNNVLLCVATGAYSKDLDQRVAKSNDTSIIIEELMERLRIAFPKAPEPIKISASKWCADPLTGGTYSYCELGCEEDDFEKLAHPILDNFVLAGEHTNQKQRSTVHGAVNSGIRAANAILGDTSSEKNESSTCSTAWWNHVTNSIVCFLIVAVFI